jgi:hypothetical protein
MKLIKLVFILVAATALVLVLGGAALSFHDGGVAECSGCHGMHNNVGPSLTLGTNPSDTCLNGTCHGSYGQLYTDGTAYRPGGNFYWMTKTFTWSAHGHSSTSEGDRHGHNIIVADIATINEDATNPNAPIYVAGAIDRNNASGYDSTYLGCNSCHDPHGESHTNLLLYTTGDAGPSNYPSAPTWLAAAATIDGNFRKSNATDANHPAYKSGISDWCANCHTDFNDNISKHVVDVNGSTINTNYNAYTGTDGTLTGGYWELVPVQNPAILTNTTSAPTSSQVMCLTCHRAHASAFDYAARWDLGATVLEDSHPATGDGGVTGTDVVDSYYGRPAWPAGQRSLCNKCHAKD